MSKAKYKKRYGDRADGRRLRTFPALNQVMSFIMAKRNDACNYFSESVEISEVDRWIRSIRREGYKGLGMLHVFIAAYIRMLSHVPGLNRFVSGQRVFARNTIEVNFMVKRGLTIDAEETLVKVRFKPTDTIYDVYDRISDAVEDIKASPGDSGTEKIAGAMAKLPRLILRFAVSFLSFLDYFGWLPESILDVSPFHGSIILTDLGSLGIPPVFHHLYNFGNLPVFLAFGAKRNSYELDRQGNFVSKKYIDYKVVCDERICDGSCYAAGFKYMKYYLKNPDELIYPPEHVTEDID